MKKKVAIRCLIGAPIGVAINTIITIAISLIVGDGRFYAVVPELIADCGTEINAVLLQTICSLLYGAAWAGASIIWEVDNWSILRQTTTHLIICSLCTFPIAYFMRWMNHSILGILSFRAKKDAVFITISEDLIIAQKLIKRKSIFKIVLSRLFL